MLNLPKRINSSILYLTYNPLKETLSYDLKNLVKTIQLLRASYSQFQAMCEKLEPDLHKA